MWAFLRSFWRKISTDINAIMSFGVMVTPALAVDGQVKTVGKVPSPDEIKTMLAGQQE